MKKFCEEYNKNIFGFRIISVWVGQHNNNRWLQTTCVQIELPLNLTLKSMLEVINIFKSIKKYVKGYFYTIRKYFWDFLPWIE